ncbi:hypothetical protein NPIL_343901 [Nephila pilipes]|uniref:Uncharacterized protein n=1 Tax=Nephila pilipes TaxID=299642 RepID=A0A8X6UTK7_NEPPI|nr:hypothetical protein NPIL_343901 [Nephila pilipes]
MLGRDLHTHQTTNTLASLLAHFCSPQLALLRYASRGAKRLPAIMLCKPRSKRPYPTAFTNLQMRSYTLNARFYLCQLFDAKAITLAAAQCRCSFCVWKRLYGTIP